MKSFKPMLSIGLLAAGLSSQFVSFAGQGPKPSICDRPCWGARNSSCSGTMSSLTRAIVHHTAGASDWTTSLETAKSKVRGVQNLHMDGNGWCDIGYHFLVSAGGHIFEGRKNSMTGLPTGAHDGCNSSSFGFSVLGYYHSPYNHSFTSAARSGVEAVIAWRMPSAWSPYNSGTYCSRTVGFMDGHYKVKSTACPGDIIIAQLAAMRDGVNARKSGSVSESHYIGVLYSDGLFSAKNGSYGAWYNQISGASAIQMNGHRFGAMVNDVVYVKEGLEGGWTTQNGGGSRKFQLHGNRIGVLYHSGILSAKDGLYGAWYDQTDAVSDFQLEGDRIGALRNGVLLVKEGLQGAWTTQTGSGVVQFQLAGNRIGVLYSDGLLSCKDGLYGSWYNQMANVASFHLYGDRIAAISGGVVYAKDGIQGSWTTQTGGGYSAVQLHGNRIAVLSQDGWLVAKDGLYGTWYTQIDKVTAFQLDGDRIGCITGGIMTVKYGLQGSWVNQTGTGVVAFALTTGQ